MKIPFTTGQFFDVIKNYNESVFPVQIILLIFAIAAFWFIFTPGSVKNKWIGGFLGLVWLWTGIFYHLVYFTTINKAAYIFGTLFIIQSLLLFMDSFVRKKLGFVYKKNIAGVLALFFILFGVFIYPVLIYFIEGTVFQTITVGLPCPTTILTFGFLMLTTPRMPKYLLVIPILWTIVGTSAAFNFGVYPDYMMPVAALVAVIYLLSRRRTAVNAGKA